MTNRSRISWADAQRNILAFSTYSSVDLLPTNRKFFKASSLALYSANILELAIFSPIPIDPSPSATATHAKYLTLSHILSSGVFQWYALQQLTRYHWLAFSFLNFFARR